ncbi:hypothetical protein [Chryseobacterium sp. SNU WT5]|nr:hypothetical protein [Chryseobacterium sp. SNU WT5]
MITLIIVLMFGICIGFLLGLIAYLIADGLFQIDLSKPHDEYD